LRTSRGDLTAEILISAPGYSQSHHSPKSSLDAFPGEVFHSARWNQDYDMTASRVGRRRNRGREIQIIPEIQPKSRRPHPLHSARQPGSWAPRTAGSPSRTLV